MARIRSVKPDFFRDESLQDLEASHPELKPMLTFEGLWCQSDKAGNFPWNPRMLHLDILPFIEYDLSASLVLLREAGMISQYDGPDGKSYGHIHTFHKHQRINGKEAQDAAKFPEYIEGSNGEATGKQLRSQEGKGREREGKGESASPPLDFSSLKPIEAARMFLQNDDICIPVTQFELADTAAALEAVMRQEKLACFAALEWMLERAKKYKGSGKIVGPGWARGAKYNLLEKKQVRMVLARDNMA